MPPPLSADPDVQALRAEVSRLVDAVSTWTPNRWQARAAGPAGPAGAERTAPDSGTRAGVAFALVCLLAELGGRAGTGAPAGQPPPRLHDLALASQLQVVGTDLLAARPTSEVILAARSAVHSAAIALGLT